MMYRIYTLALVLGIVAASPAWADSAKNAILFIGDGMGPGQVTAARIYQNNARDGQLTLDTMPYTAIVKTYAADRMVTDSAASGTALATGVKTNILKVGQDPDGNDLETILEKAKLAGKSVGIVSTTSITHATPASFYGKVPNRGREDLLAEQLVEYGQIDVVMGGGRQVFIPQDATDPENDGRSRRRDDRDLFAEAEANGYRIIFKQEEFDALRKEVAAGDDPGKILALFSPGMMSYEIQRERDKWGEPSLAEMTETAIAILAQNPAGYFLMVEGGRIDHASHDNNALRTVTEMIAFDEALQVALDTTDDTDTLIVVTADHETGGLTINGYPRIEIGGNALFTESPGGTVTDIITFSNGPGANREEYESMDRDDPSYRQPAAFLTSSATHTGVDVYAYASGPGAEGFRGTIDNTDIALKMMAALGLK